VIKNSKGEYVGKNIENDLPIFEMKLNAYESDRFDTKDDAEQIIIIINDQFPNETFTISQEELPVN
jgi:hypothetical protein